MESLKHLIHQVHRRSLWQVVSIYIAGGWIVYQVALNLMEGVGLPDWVPAFALVLLLIGLPIVVATAFVQEGGPSPQPRAGRRSGSEGSRAEQDEHEVEPSESRQPTEWDVVLSSSRAARPPIVHLLTWSRALLGGVLAFAALGAGTAGYMTLRVLGIGPAGSLVAAGVIDASDRIIVADFRTTSGDTALAAIVTEAFRMDLARSTLVRTVAPTEVRDALVRAGREPTTRVDTELARELAVRGGIKAFIDGDVATVAGAYVLNARLIAAATGEVLSAHRETANDSTALLGAIDRLSRSLRERTGESLREVRRGEPLAQVMTPSLEALRLYTDAMRAHVFEGDPRKAQTLIEEAVAIDTAFASGHRALGVFWSNRGRSDLALAAAERALLFPERLTERERYLAQASVHTQRREYDRGIGAYEALLSRYPQDRTALNNIGLLYSDMGDYARAIQFYQRAIEADTASFFSRANLGEALVMAGRFEEARAAFDAARQRAPASPWAVVHYASLPAASGDYAAAEHALRALYADSTAAPVVTEIATYRLASVLRTQGRLREVRPLEATLTAGRPRAEADRMMTMERAYEELLLHENTARAVALLDGIAAHMDSQPAFSPPLLGVAMAYAYAGEIDRARMLLDRYARVEQRAEPWIDRDVFAVEGLIALARGDAAGAVRLFRRSADADCASCEELLVGRAFEAWPRPDSAITAYERYLAQPSMDRVRFESLDLVPLHERLAFLYDQRGDRAQAARHYARVVELWQRADPELQPRVTTARRALERLVAERGG